jgi:hypothetical protein
LIIRGLQIVYFFILAASWGLTLFLYLIDYQQFSYQVLDFYQQTDKLQKFQRDLLTPTRFNWLKIGSLAISIGLLGLSFYSRQIIQNGLVYLKLVYAELKSSLFYNYLIINQLTKKQSLVFFASLALVFIPKIFSLVYYPITLDEAFSYIFLIDKGLAVSAVYYPGPNNHVLFSICSVGTYAIFGGFLPEPVWAMRLVSLGAFGLTISALGLGFLRIFGFNRAIAGLFCVGFASPIMVYGFLGRGYMLQMWFFLGLLWASGRLVSQPQSILGHWVFALASVGGFYTIPSFLYPFVSILIFVFFKVNQTIYTHKLLIINLLIIFIIVFLLYTPIILFNGWGALVQNPWVKPLPWAAFLGQMPAYISQASRFFFPIGGIWFIGIIFFFWLFQLTKNQTKNPFKLLINCLIISPLLILFCQKLLPPERVWVYQSLTLTVLILTSFDFSRQIHTSLKIKVVYIFIVLIIFLNQINFYTSNYLIDYQILIQKSLANNFDSVFVNDDNYNIFFRYEYLKKQQSLAIEVENFDANKKYDLIIFAKNRPLPSHFERSKHQLYFENTVVKAYISKAK